MKAPEGNSSSLIYSRSANFFPVADRELRVAARSKATHRWRFFFAVGALAIAGALELILLASSGAFASELGEYLFAALKWTGFIYACAAGTFLTADCLSEEKRDGTLGLIFLTDLRGRDVVMGKLLSTSLRSFYSLLAIFPIMAFSFVMGGVEAGDFTHSLIAICNTLFFSLALGMVISVVSRDTHKAMTGTLAVMCAFLFLPFQLDDWLFVPGGGGSWFGLLSPAFSLVRSADTRTFDFWLSTIIVHLTGWCFLAVASWLVPRTWQEKTARGPTGKSWQSPLFVSARSRLNRQKFLEQSPVGWIIARDRWASSLARIAILLILGVFVLSLFSVPWSAILAPVKPVVVTTTPTSTNLKSTTGKTTTRIIIQPSGGAYTMTVNARAAANGISTSIPFEVATLAARILLLAMEFWLVAHITRFYVEAKKNGFMELLLVTPIRPNEIVSSHWLALRRLFLAPAIALVGLELTLGAIRMLATGWPVLPTLDDSWMIQIVSLVISEIAWVTGMFALAWYSIWMGIGSKKISIAMLKTFCFVIILPRFGMYFVTVLAAFAFAQSFGMSRFWLIALIPELLMIGVNLGLAFLARNSVSGAFSRWVAA